MYTYICIYILYKQTRVYIQIKNEYSHIYLQFIIYLNIYKYIKIIAGI